MFILLGSSCCVWLLYSRGRLSVRSSYKTSSINKKSAKVVALNILCVDMTFLCLQKGVLEEIRSYMCVMIL
jgi:hypothetical protein